MTTYPTTVHPITGPAPGPRRSLTARLLREARHALILAAAALATIGAAWLLRQALPFHVWWPLLTGGALTGVLAAQTPPGSTTVLHASRLAIAHPAHALAVAALVCVPWLGDWTLTAVRAGAEAAVRSALDAAPSTPDVAGWLADHLGGRP